MKRWACVLVLAVLAGCGGGGVDDEAAERTDRERDGLRCFRVEPDGMVCR